MHSFEMYQFYDSQTNFFDNVTEYYPMFIVTLQKPSVLSISLLLCLAWNLIFSVLVCKNYGLFSFLNGVSSNATVNLLEKKYGRLFMSTCHGMYSLGGATSAGIAALLFVFHIPSGFQIVCVAIILILVILSNKHHLLANH